MKKAKNSLFLILFTVALTVLVAPFAALAADVSSANGVPAQAISPWTALVPIAVPALLALLKVFAPKIPSVALPILAPLLGAGADIVLHYAGVSTLGPLWGAVLGSAGVGLRELQDQLKQTVLPSATPTDSGK
jgi:hypothetical protein